MAEEGAPEDGAAIADGALRPSVSTADPAAGLRRGEGAAHPAGPPGEAMPPAAEAGPAVLPPTVPAPGVTAAGDLPAPRADPPALAAAPPSGSGGAGPDATPAAAPDRLPKPMTPAAQAALAASGAALRVGSPAEPELAARPASPSRVTPVQASGGAMPEPASPVAPNAPSAPMPQTVVAWPGAMPLAQAGLSAAVLAPGRDADPMRADSPGGAIEIATARPAAPPPGGAPLTPPGAPVPVHRQIAQAAQDLSRGPVELRLSPEELGSVRLTLQAQEGGLTVQVAAERQETLQLIRRHADALAEALRDGGFADVSFSFRQDGRRGGTAPPPAAADPRSGVVPLPELAPAGGVKSQPATGLDMRL
ncbi:MAG: flagellar hook-length control protein FliK [Tranquillimonas sp.]